MSVLAKQLAEVIISQHQDSIEMFLEYRDKHGYDEDKAKKAAVDEARQGWEISDPVIAACLPFAFKKALDAETENARLKAKLEQADKRLKNATESWKEQGYRLRQYMELVSAINNKPEGEYYTWQPGEENHLESLLCPVLIPAEWLRNILDEARIEGKIELKGKSAAVLEALEKIAYHHCRARWSDGWPEEKYNDLEEAYDELRAIAEQALSTTNHEYVERVRCLETMAKAVGRVDGFMLTLGLQRATEMPEAFLQKSYEAVSIALQEMHNAYKNLTTLKGEVN